MTPAMRLAALAISLIAGEAAGFAAPKAACIWGWAAAADIMLALIAWGWQIRHALPFVFFMYGVAAAMRAEHMRACTLECHWRSGCGGCIPVLDLPVESSVNVRNSADGRKYVEFLSHAGSIPLKVVLRRGDLSSGPIPSPGETWRCAGGISRQTIHPGLFSRRMYWGKIDGLAVRVADPSRSFLGLGKLRDIFAGRAAIGLGWCPGLAAINRAILLGSRDGLPPAQRKMFAQAGAIHVFAISGLHVMLISAMLVRVISCLRMPKRLQGIVSLPFLVAYVILTGMRPSAVRAAAMAGICLSAPVFGRKGDPLAAWSLTALSVYGACPQRIYDTGCTLSFMAMFGIVAWLRWVSPMLPAYGRKGVLGGAGVSIAAWIAGVPMVVCTFGCFTVGGLVANLAVIPLATCLVAFGMTGMVLGFVFPSAAALFNNLAALMAWSMCKVSGLVASLPFSSFTVEPWSWWICVSWYAGWTGVFVLLTRVLKSRESSSSLISTSGFGII